MLGAKADPQQGFEHAVAEPTFAHARAGAGEALEGRAKADHRTEFEPFPAAFINACEAWTWQIPQHCARRSVAESA
jgi:hypothetical protein